MTKIVFETRHRESGTLAYTVSSEPDTIFINAHAWFTEPAVKKNRVIHTLLSTLSHEEIHNVLTRIDEDSASYALDLLEEEGIAHFPMHGVGLPSRLRK